MKQLSLKKEKMTTEITDEMAEQLDTTIIDKKKLNMAMV